MDLERVDAENCEHELKKAIRTNDRAAMAENLRKLARNLSPEIVYKLADYIDPDIEKPIYKSGPKQKKKASFIECAQMASFYYYLCNNKEQARFINQQSKNPTATQIKKFICREFAISEREFDTRLSYANNGKKPK